MGKIPNGSATEGLQGIARQGPFDALRLRCYKRENVPMQSGGAVAQLGARLDGIEEVVGSNPIGSTKRP